MARGTALLLALLLCACGESRVRSEGVKSAPAHSLAHPLAPPVSHGLADASSTRAAPQRVDGVELVPIDAIEELVERAIARRELPGCVIGVGTKDGLVYLQAFGERTQGEPMTVDTRFDLASLTKPIATAASVIALAEQGVIDLNAPASRYLRELKSADKRAISVRQLLLHRAGLPKVNPLSHMEQGRSHAINMIARLPLEAVPGARFEYSDLGFILLGELVERVTGERLDTYASRRLFAPLGMRDTAFVPQPEDAARCAPTEERDEQVIRGVVDDPRAYRLGGVAGHAGLFSTASDVARFAQMLLRRGELNGTRVLREDTVARFMEPHELSGIVRALGWDARSPYAHGRGLRFGARAIGHGGYTGTSLWLDPERDMFVVLLSNRVHMGPRGSIHPLTSSVADVAVRALENRENKRLQVGIDVLAQEAFARIRGRSVALLTHAAACDRDGARTLDRITQGSGFTLKAIFTPEHGFDAKHEGHVAHQRLGEWPLYSLFGKTRKPTPEMLAGVDTIVIDLVDVGARFYTYMATVLATLDAASEQNLEVVLLDRPNPIDGVHVEGPISELSFASFVNYHPLPLRHGMSAGELARFLVSERNLQVKLSVVRVENWTRAQWNGDTDLAWRAPSPNLATREQAMLYPAVALVEGTNLSVGRGTGRAFAVIGAPFIDGKALAAALTESELQGVAVAATRFRPTLGPYAGERIGGIALTLTEAHSFSAARTGLALISALSRLYPEAWDRTRLDRMVADQSTLELLAQRAALPQIESSWAERLRVFEVARERALLY